MKKKLIFEIEEVNGEEFINITYQGFTYLELMGIPEAIKFQIDSEFQTKRKTESKNVMDNSQEEK